VNVLDDEHDRSCSRGARKDREQLLEQARLPTLRSAGQRLIGEDLDRRPCVFSDQRAQRADDRRVRKFALADGRAIAKQHGRAAGACPSLEFGDEAALAHPRLRSHDHRRARAVPSARDRRLEQRQLLAASDEPRAPDATGHGADYPRHAEPHLRGEIRQMHDGKRAAYAYVRCEPVQPKQEEDAS
jgi:hypothetical protein